jgi:hypothetical protein
MSDPKIIEKIKKLLALSLSDNPHEAKLAAQRAVDLMASYGISETDLDNNPFVSETFKSRHYYKLPIWVSTLWGQLGWASGCFVVYQHGAKCWGKKASVTVAGKKSDVEIMHYMGEYFEDEIYKKSEEFKKLHERLKPSVYNQYKQGLGIGISHLIKKSQDEFFQHHCETVGKSLVPIDIKLQEAQEYFEGFNKVARTVKRDTESPAVLKGMIDASEISISKGVAGTTNTLALEHKAQS